MNEPVNVWDYEALAAERLEAGAHGYYAGGAGDELTRLTTADLVAGARALGEEPEPQRGERGQWFGRRR